MNKEDEYYTKLIIRAFNAALFIYGEECLKNNPRLLLIEMDCLSNIDRHLATMSMEFKN